MFIPSCFRVEPGRYRNPGLLDWLVKRKLHERIRNDRAFNITVPGKGRLCPYCLETAPRGRSEEENSSLLVDHILYSCGVFFGIKTPVQPQERIEATMEMHRIREQVKSHPSWNLTDENGFWVCPFCARATQIYFSRKTKGERGLIAEIYRHLKECPSYAAPGAAPRDAEDLRRQIRLAAKESILVDQIRERIGRESPFFRLLTKRGDWVCPFCLKRHIEIRLDTHIMRRHTAPALIARHLIYDCEAFKRNPTTRSLREIALRLAELNGELAPQIRPNCTILRLQPK